MPVQLNRKPTQWESLTAGKIAGAVEGAATYPAEFLKTKAQFASSATGQPSTSLLGILQNTIKTQGVRGLYSGSGALIAGNGLKAGVRFMTYDSIKELLRGDDVSAWLLAVVLTPNQTESGVALRRVCQ